MLIMHSQENVMEQGPYTEQGPFTEQEPTTEQEQTTEQGPSTEYRPSTEYGSSTGQSSSNHTIKSGIQTRPVPQIIVIPDDDKMAEIPNPFPFPATYGTNIDVALLTGSNIWCIACILI